jgi:hypothetical protein
MADTTFDNMLTDDERAAVVRFHQQLLIVMVKHRGKQSGYVDLSLQEIDNTGQDLLRIEYDDMRKMFRLKLTKKS